eukprot:5441305-Prymnesium_polylepis.1
MGRLTLPHARLRLQAVDAVEGTGGGGGGGGAGSGSGGGSGSGSGGGGGGRTSSTCLVGVRMEALDGSVTDGAAGWADGAPSSVAPSRGNSQL